jgi:UrcA family protein
MDDRHDGRPQERISIMRTIVTNTLFAAASAALTIGAVLISTPASAETTDVLTRHIDVHYSDLDLTSTGGRATLKHRIHAAAYNVCTTDEQFTGQTASAACREKAVADATRRMDTLIAEANTAKRIALR